MSRQISRIIALAVCTLMGLAAAQVMADDYRQLNRQINQSARKIHSKSQSLSNETKHYRATPNYVHIVSAVAALDQAACQLRDRAKAEGNLDQMAADVAEIDINFHHIQELFDQTEHLASYGHGSIKGHTAHVKRSLNDIKEAIDHICHDIEKLRHLKPAVAAPVPHAVYPKPYPYPAYQRHDTRIQTYRVPGKRHDGDQAGYHYTPYGGRTTHSAKHHHDYKHRSEHRGGEITFGGKNARFTFRF